jgi:hypothetical protein
MLTPQISPPLVGGDEGEGETASFDPPPPLPTGGRAHPPPSRGEGEKKLKKIKERRELWKFGVKSYEFRV